MFCTTKSHKQTAMLFCAVSGFVQRIRKIPSQITIDRVRGSIKTRILFPCFTLTRSLRPRALLGAFVGTRRDGLNSLVNSVRVTQFPGDKQSICDYTPLGDGKYLGLMKSFIPLF